VKNKIVNFINSKSFCKRKFFYLHSFTLAELLITLGIIGLIAVIITPNIVGYYREKQTIVQVKKFYSVISNIYNSIRFEHGELNANFSVEVPDNSNFIIDLICKNLKCNQIFYTGTPERQVIINNFVNKDGGKIYSRNGDLEVNTFGHEYRAVATLNDGTIFAVKGTKRTETSFNCLSSKGNNGSNYCFSIDYVSNPRRLQRGKSFFTFYAFKDRILPAGTQDFYYYSSYEDYCVIGGTACTAWLLAFENMDYLHCPNELSWQGKHSCK